MAPQVTTAAILFTDMVASTELRSRLGDGRAEQLRKAHDGLLAAAVDEHHGQVLRWTGDGIKAVFSNSSDAVGAAVAIQRAVTAYGASAAAVAVFEVRIGLAVGEVLIDDGDHHGVPVIEAARLEALARPGEILATDVVRALAQRRSSVAFEPAGERTLKGLDRPITVHRVVDLGAAAVPPLPRTLADGVALPMVGRDAHLRSFSDMWTPARAGSTRLLVVHGRAGLGASRFLAACGAAAHLDGAIVLAGSCSSDLDVPYEAFLAALRDVATLDRSLELAVHDRAGPLARLFPGSASSAAEAQPATARFELFDAVAALLRRLSRTHPVLLVIDDLHRASASTLLLLRHVVTELVDERLLVVASYADDPLDARHALRDLVGAIRPSTRVSQIELGPLTVDDIGTLVRTSAPDLPPARAGELAHLVHDETSGAPLFASALIEHLLPAWRSPHTAADDPVPIPSSVHEVVRQRLVRLGGDALDVLTSAAIVGASFDIEILAVVARRPADDVLDLVDEAARAGFVVETGIDHFAFAHSVVRNALLDGLGPTRRARAHRRAAEALESQGDDRFDDLAHHWRHAGDEARATSHLARAAHRDLVALAYESARSRFQEVVAMLARDSRADVLVRAEAWLGLGAAGRALGDPSYTQALDRAARLGRTARAPRIMAEAAALSTWPGTFFFVAEVPDTDLIELCQDALELLERSDPLRVRVLATLASHSTFAAPRDRRIELIREATELAALHADPMLTAVVLNAEFLCLWDPSTLERREQIGRDLSRIGRATGDSEMTFLGGFFSAFCTAERGDLGAARTRLAELAGVVEATRNQYFEFLADRLAISIDIATCAPAVAERVDALALRHGATHADTDGTWALQTGGLSYQAGTLGSMVNAMQAMTAGPQARTWLAALALAQLWAGDRSGATTTLAAQAEAPRNYFWITVAQVQAEVAAAVGATDRCAGLFAELLPFRGLLGITASGSLCFGLVSRSLGELALALGDTDMAGELLEEATTQADRIGMPLESVIGRRLLATAQLAGGNAARARTLVDEARSIATDRGFAREVALLDELVPPSSG